MANVLVIVSILSILTGLTGGALFNIPDLKIEATKSGKVRVSVPHVDGISKFEFHTNVNKEILREEKGDFFNQTRKREGDFWVLYFDIPVAVGDNLNYWVFFIANLGGYKTDSEWTVEELVDSLKPLKKCIKSPTLSTSIGIECSGDEILIDDFDGARIDANKWLVEHRIPTYFGANDNYVFNSYEDTDQTRFIKNGILYLKPIPRLSKEDINGILDLKNGCTSRDEKQCYHEKSRGFIIPPARSAKIVSKQSFQYGKIDVRAKLPAGDWIIPIIQLQLRNPDSDVDSPRVLIAYSRGNLHLCGVGENGIGAQWLYGGAILKIDEDGGNEFLNKYFNNTPYNTDFHVYTLEWMPGKMSFYIDSNHYGDVATSEGFINVRSDWRDHDAPFNKEYILTLGVAVGGLHDFPDNCNSGNYEKPWMNASPLYAKTFFDANEKWLKTWIDDNTALQIDYVRIWAA